MTIYTTPLQFGYFLALLFSFLLFIRGFREERLSDKLLAAVLFLLAMEVQDYTFGFAGINYLWTELNGFPRHFGLAFAPTIYYYLRAQLNSNFKLEIKHLRAYIPYLIYFISYLVLFLNGPKVVKAFESHAANYWVQWFLTIVILSSYVYFFSKSLKLYQQYQKWTSTQFSDTETISFDWVRNFIYLIIAGEIFRYGWNLADFVYDLPYENDWWWHLLTVGIICYVSIRGYTQVQYKKIQFTSIQTQETTAEPKLNNLNFEDFIPKIANLFEVDKVFLEPDISLAEVARKLKTNSSVISAAINQGYGKNFNDFVNEYRIREFEVQVQNSDNKHYTKLAIALDCGFNSKATFNRALKKFGI